MDLRGADLQDVILQGAILQGGKLQRVNLRSVNLRNTDLRHANLLNTDLQGAALWGANLQGANLDHSCWPLWCGSLGIKIDKRIFCQLAYHLCRTIVDDEECKAAQKALYPLANQFHRVGECGRLGEEDNHD